MTTAHGGGALRAGLDIGNATTEGVLVDRSGVVVAADRMPTRGGKGTAASLEGAAVLLRRCARSLGGEVPELVGEVVTTAIRPVRTLTTQVVARVVGTGPLAVLTTGS